MRLLSAAIVNEKDSPASALENASASSNRQNHSREVWRTRYAAAAFELNEDYATYVLEPYED